MRRLMWTIGNKFFPGVRDIVSNFRILAMKQGQWRTIRSRSATDVEGIAVPWYTYPAIEYLRGFDFSTCDVFEFGSGNSSLYWANRARSVVSVEHDKNWFHEVEGRRCANQVVLHRADRESYTRAVVEQGRLFDVIVIDGEWRMECALSALPCLKESGLILLDNSDRVAELACGEWLRNQGLFQVDFSGFGPINGYCWSTSLFFRDGRGMQTGFKGPVPIGGLKN